MILKTANSTLNRLIKIKYDVAELYFLKGKFNGASQAIFARPRELLFGFRTAAPIGQEALSNLYNSKTFLCDWGEKEKKK